MSDEDMNEVERVHNYLPFFDISVKHDYFEDGSCDCLEFVATESTTRIIQNSGLLLRKTHTGISVGYNENELEALQLFASDEDDVLKLEFKVYSHAPEFKGYSEPFTRSNSEVLYFNVTDGGIGDDGSVRLHAGDYVTRNDLRMFDSPELKDVLSRKDRVMPPVFFIQIVMRGSASPFFDDQLKPVYRQCWIHLRARQAIWKYLVMGKSAKDGIYISDVDSHIEFETEGWELLADQTKAMSFRSKQILPMKEKYDYHFQLKQKGAGVDKVCIKRLPVARVNQAGEVVNAEQGVVVSEIYVNS